MSPRGGTEGVTDASGTFKYKAGETVTFYLGGILLGEATGAAILTPVSLVPGAMDESNATVANIARFLQTLDDDDNPDNGIQINADVVADTAGKVIDFTLNEADFDSATAAIITELTAMRAAGARTLLSAADAKLHLAGSLLCGRAGSYAGTYTGDADGDWSFVAEADGTITGSGKSTTFPDDPVFVIGGSVSSSGDSVVGSTTSGAEFSGTVELDGTVSGEWHNTDGSASGTYSGSRISGPSEPCSATGGGGTGFGFGSVAVSGDDTSVIDTAFTPNEVTAPDSVTLRWRQEVRAL